MTRLASLYTTQGKETVNLVFIEKVLAEKKIHNLSTRRLGNHKNRFLIYLKKSVHGGELILHYFHCETWWWQKKRKRKKKTFNFSKTEKGYFLFCGMLKLMGNGKRKHKVSILMIKKYI